jgi:exodeoxyribonuclease-3
MKFISWNVNGLRACIKPKTDDDGNVVSKGFEAYFKELDADFFCLQETKMQQGQLDLEFDGYQSYWNYADKKGYSGTAIFTRHQPLAVTYGLGIDEHDTRDVSSHWSIPTFTSSPATRPTRRRHCRER